MLGAKIIAVAIVVILDVVGGIERVVVDVFGRAEMLVVKINISRGKIKQ